MAVFHPIDAKSFQCIEHATNYYGTPYSLSLAIIKKESGRPGTESKNRDGSLDLGRAQINSIHLGELKKFKIDKEMLRDNDCVNIYVSNWILKQNYNKYGDWTKAVIAYNIGFKWTPKRLAIGKKYANEVIAYWRSYYAHFKK